MRLYNQKVYYIVNTRCDKEKTSDGAWMLLSTTAWVSVLSVGGSMHELRRQRMHGHQFVARFLVGRDRRCWRRAVKSVMECWWPAWAGWWCSPTPDQSGHCGCSGPVVEYRTRNREVAGSTHTRSTASNLEQVANLLCAQANSASYPHQDGKWVRLLGEGLVWLIRAIVCLLAAPWVQLSVSANNGWTHNALRHHSSCQSLPRL